MAKHNGFFFKFTDGKCMACTYRAKFVEVSVGINHNVDELLAGTLTQIRLKKEQNALQVSINPHYLIVFRIKTQTNGKIRSKRVMKRHFAKYMRGIISKQKSDKRHAARIVNNKSQVT